MLSTGEDLLLVQEEDARQNQSECVVETQDL